MPAVLSPDAVPRRASDRVVVLRAELADVQLDLMQVLETDPAASADLRAREAALKYALREEQIRRDRTGAGAVGAGGLS